MPGNDSPNGRSLSHGRGSGTVVCSGGQAGVIRDGEAAGGSHVLVTVRNCRKCRHGHVFERDGEGCIGSVSIAVISREGDKLSCVMPGNDSPNGRSLGHGRGSGAVVCSRGQAGVLRDGEAAGGSHVLVTVGNYRKCRHGHVLECHGEGGVSGIAVAVISREGDELGGIMP